MAVTPSAKKSRMDGPPNPHLGSMESDFLYHIGYSREEARKLFRDVKFVVMGGSKGRMAGFAEFIAREIGHPDQKREQLDISKTDRFAFFKIGPVLSISHGMGVPSVSILLHEMIKLLLYAEANDAILIRIGTSGGIGVSAGTVVVTNRSFNPFLREEHEIVILGETIRRPCKLDEDLVREILSCQDDHSFQTIPGGTMCTDDFYEGQGRLDGAVCQFEDKDKMAYLKRVQAAGVVNIEMECTALSSLCYQAGMKCAVVCVTLLDRLEGDQVDLRPEDYQMYQTRLQGLVAKFIKSRLGVSHSNAASNSN